MCFRSFLLVAAPPLLLFAASSKSHAQERRGLEVNLAAVAPEEESDSRIAEYRVPDDISYFEIGKVSGGLVEVLESRVSLLDGSDSKEDRVRVALLHRGVQVPSIPVAPGSLIRLLDGEEKASVFGIEVRNEILQAVKALGGQLSVENERIVAGLEKGREQTAASSEDLVMELDEINETITSAHYKTKWKYRIVEIEFKHVGELAKKLGERGEPDYSLVQVIAGERRPGQHRGEVTAIYRRAVLPESVPKGLLVDDASPDQEKEDE